MAVRVGITGMGLLTPTGTSPQACFEALARGVTGFRFDEDLGVPLGPVQFNGEEGQIRGYARRLDRTALMAIAAGKSALAGRNGADTRGLGVIVGTSRGAALSFEKYHLDYLSRHQSSPSMSPVTTGVTLSSAVAAANGCWGPVFSLSAACMGGMTAIGTAFGLIHAGQAPGFIAGGSEACLSGFTVGSLDRLHLLSHNRHRYPLQAGEPGRDGTVLSEGAVLFVLEATSALPGPNIVPLAEIVAFAQASETETLTGISENAEALQRCLASVLRRQPWPDLVIGHFAGTPNGDQAEVNAYRKLLPPEIPITALKWSTGHMLAASPSFSVAMAVECMRQGLIPGLPYATAHNIIPGVRPAPPVVKKIRTVLVTALGFGGGAAALLLRSAKENGRLEEDS